MLKHIYSVLCERISTDENTHLVSYLSCVEGLTTTKLPVRLQNLAFGSRWHKYGESEEILKFRLSLVSTTGEEKVLIESEELTVRSDNHRINIALEGLLFEQAGIYTFRLRKQENGKWVVVHEIPLKVELKSSDMKKELIKHKSVKIPQSSN